MVDWNKFINENRAEIDEFLGPNNPTYSAIALKGQIVKHFKDKFRVLDYFGALMKTGLNQKQQNNYLRKLLKELKDNTHTPQDVLMRFGVNTNLLIGIDKEIFEELMENEIEWTK